MATPTLVQSCCTNSSNGANETVSYDIYFPNPTLAGNFLVLFFAWAPNVGSPTFTVTDDQSQTWTADVTSNQATDGYNLSNFFFANTAAGVQHVTVTVGNSATNGFFQGILQEYNNVATTSPKDVASVKATNASGSNAFTPGTITTSTAGDLIIVCAADSHGDFPQTTGFTPAASFTLDQGELVFGMAIQHQVQGAAGNITSANMAITSPSAGTSNWVAIGMALKSASAGTAPSSPWINRVQFVDFKQASGTTTVGQFVPTGNVIAIGWLGSQGSAAGTRSMSAISDGTNTYTRSAGHGDAQSGLAQWGYSIGSTPGSYIITVTTVADNASSWAIYDINLTSAQFDQVHGSTGVQSVAGNLSTDTCTPARSGGFLLNVTGINAGSLQNAVGAGFNTIHPWAHDETGGGAQLHQNNGWAMFQPTNTSAQTFVYAVASGPTADWGSETLSLVPPAAAVATGPILQFPAAHPGGPGLTGTLGMAMRAMQKTQVPGTATVIDDPNFPLPLPATHPFGPGLSGSLGMVMRAMTKTFTPGTATVLSDPNPPLLPAGIFPGATGLKGGLNMLMRAMGQVGKFPPVAAPVTILQRRTFHEFGTHAGGRTIRGD